MPIRIKELVVRTNVSNKEGNEKENLTETDFFKIRNWIMEECLDEVNKLLEKRNLK